MRTITLKPMMVEQERTIFSLRKRFKDLTLVRETELTTDKWAKRGLDRTIMEKIAHRMNTPL